MAVVNVRAGRCWGCGGVGHYITQYPGRSLPVAESDGSFPRELFGGGLKRGRGDVSGATGGKGGPLRGGCVLGYVNTSRGTMGGAPQGAR